jgi:hypothetical protein
MKREVPSFVVALSMLLALVCLPSIVQGQTKERFVVDTGVISPSSNQVLRLTVAGPGNDTITVRFRRQQYSPGTCGGGVCVQQVASDDTSGPVTLSAGEAASINVSSTPAFPSVRAMLLSNNRDVRVTAQIIDIATGEVIAIWVPQGSPAVGKE